MLGALLVLFAVPILVPRANAAQGPCCVITVIDARTGVVTAAENKNKRTFEFKVGDGKLPQALKVGQPVYADWKNPVTCNAAEYFCEGLRRTGGE